MEDFYTLLLRSDVYVVTKDRSLPDGTVLIEDKQVPIYLPIITVTSNATQISLVAFFSCIKKIKTIPNDPVGYCKMSFKNFLNMMKCKPSVLNPNTDCSKEFTTEELKALLARIKD